MRKQLFFSEMLAKYTLVKLLEQIAFMISKSRSRNFTEPKPTLLENESTDAIAKHAALHDYGHHKAFPPPLPDDNPFSQIYWLAKEKRETTHPTTTSGLVGLALLYYKTIRTNKKLT